MPENHVIVGAGQAGGRAAEAMRVHGFTGRIVLIGDEPHLPYERPPLSKQVLLGEYEPEKTHLNPAEFYAEQRIELRLGTRVVAIDREARRVALGDGAVEVYDKLLLTTGSRVRRLPLPGSELAGVHVLRGIEDALAIRDALGPGVRIAIVGGGYIGLEVAAAARMRECQVTVIEVLDSLLARVMSAEMGDYFARLHRDRGVDLRLGTGVTAFEGAGRVERVCLGDGSTLAADAVVVAVGVAPETALAQAAGLDIGDGIVVDACARTSDPSIFAAGDATEHPNPILGRRVRLESWQNAQNQAIAAARTMCGDAEPYAEVPWFWSDQYDVNLQMLGLPDAASETVHRGEIGSAAFSIFHLRDGRAVATVAINSARDIAVARRLIAQKRPVDRARIADTESPLRELLRD
jgi:3-phenylpropionate/trans-cinnamate dioxygenase ferredoxin reductase subunit